MRWAASFPGQTATTVETGLIRSAEAKEPLLMLLASLFRSDRIKISV